MNIVQMHEVVRFWLDTIRSPRHEAEEIDKALNISIDKIIDEKYTHASLLHASDAFQKTQKVRDQLGKIVTRLSVSGGELEMPSPISSGEGKVNIVNPDNFRYLLDFMLYEGTTGYICYPTDFNSKNTLKKNPFRKPRTGSYSKTYYVEEDGGYLILYPESLTLTNAVIFALRKPADVKYGFEYDDTKTFNAGEKIIVAEKGTIYNSIKYNIGDEITIGTETSIESGLVVHGYTNCELSHTLHEEISRRAAVEILRSTGQQEKSNLLIAEFKVG